MKTEQQRIAIAEACGWVDCIFIESLGLCKGKHENSRVQYDSGHLSLPDYLNDLNAMREAEKVLLIDDQQRVYVDTLVWLNNGGNSSIRFHGRWAAATATATQRAEAFLRTIGKWEVLK